ENAAAAEALEHASKLPGSPRYLPRLVARLRSESADVEAAEIFLRQLVRDAPDEHARAEYQGALDEIEIEYRARALDRARDAFRELHGRDIEKLEDQVLGAHPVLAGLPPAEPPSLPPGLRRDSRWILDPETGEIRSTYYGRRYRVNFHPQERKRLEEWKRQRTGREDPRDAG
ncbi:MAG: hypothetical protein O7G30_00550, partial [Proteobacteria bacterium]|nr:hypothetical protein [Pseudomonadota bacterium]